MRDLEIQIGRYRIEQGDRNPCEYPEKLWLFSDGTNGGMEVRAENIEPLLDYFFKTHF